MSLLLQQLLNGLSIGVIYALVGMGITLVYGLTRVVNFAHGELVMIGAMFTAIVAQEMGWGFYTGAAMSIIVLVVLSMIMERWMFRYTLDAPINGFIVSLGLIFILRAVAILIWGTSTISLRPLIAGVSVMGDVVISNQRLLVMALTIPIFSLFFLFLKKTRMGMAMRAAAADPEVVTWMGLSVRRMVVVTFSVGGVLAAIAGSLYATILPVNTAIGGRIVLFGFAVALLGGLGSVAGSLAAGLIMGLVETLIAGYFLTEWSQAAGFLVIVLVILLRPSGLMAGTEGAEI